ncbi:hypothetical protein AJ78_00995 [Emergomyces pasteurianus Ep9510]|uniref:Uncharacterized protein n=1 Tax=Emergomyces pasteurianus Ep9510 TaxID=1447872 RepID=A0A1J9QT40_9EURO|nr:hypothetical protein AJ78_00995 [Emergomyces pasteurianus Ep9510]
MSKTENNPPVTQTVDDNEPDDWYAPSSLTSLLGLGNATSGLAGGLTLYAGTSGSSALDVQSIAPAYAHDITLYPIMEAFRECWKRHGNDHRTESKES